MGLGWKAHIFYITTDAAPKFSPDARTAKAFRSYTEAGGMIFFHNEYGSKEVDDFVNDLAKRVYPEYQLCSGGVG